jgi:hypothetical protein
MAKHVTDPIKVITEGDYRPKYLALQEKVAKKIVVMAWARPPERRGAGL